MGRQNQYGGPQKILDREMTVLRNEIQKEETYNLYGDSGRNVGLKSLEGHVAFIRLVQWGVPSGEVCINGRFVYAANHTSSKAGHSEKQNHM